MSGRFSLEDLEALVSFAPDPGRRTTAYAALTLARILAPEWTHVIAVRDSTKKIVKHESITKPAGETVGDRAGLVARLEALVDELSCQESHS